MVVAKDLIQLPCLQKWDKVRLKSPTMLVYTPPASSLLTYLFWFAFLYFNWSSLLIHFTRQKNKLGKWENFCPKKPKLRIESRVDTQPIWRKKRKTCKKESLSSREIFLNFHSLKKRLKILKKISWNCYSKREEARLPLLFLNNNGPVYCFLIFSGPYIGPDFFLSSRP